MIKCNRARFLIKKSWVPDIGQKGVQNGAFRLYLKTFTLVFADFRSERGSYGPRYVCKVRSLGKIWFSRYGTIGDPEKALSTVSCKVSDIS